MQYIPYLLLAVVVVLALWAMGVYNSLITIRNKVEEAFSTMDVYLVKRYDLIPNLVETVKGYAKHESGTLEAVIAARNAAQSSGTIEDKIANENVLTGTLSKLFALTEAYPDLKANAGFLDLQSQLKSLEEDVANARKYYNGAVRQYNTQIQVFPTNILAGMFKFTKKPLFEVEEESQRKAVKVQF
ncbi:MAG: LemA family protein [Erysipelotrichaceae bacterium]|jgi:LemA protein|nr:LemA family protein [Erysipelotrichaceae bacterium]